MLNQIVLEGRITKDPEIRQTAAGLAICNITIAVDRSVKRPDKPKAMFVNCTFFGAQAENVGRFFKKGRAIIVIGRLETDEFTGKDGTKRTMTYVAGSAFEFPLTEKNEPKAVEATPREEEKKPGDILDDDMPF